MTVADYVGAQRTVNCCRANVSLFRPHVSRRSRTSICPLWLRRSMPASCRRDALRPCVYRGGACSCKGPVRTLQICKNGVRFATQAPQSHWTERYLGV